MSRRCSRAWRRLSQRPRLAVAACFAASSAISIVITSVYLPAPRLHDEFSYLLAADTFAHGRVANPTHPHWVHFETFHVLHEPAYASKYPPLQGAVLAFGKVVLGHAIAGAWLATALAAAACCWMLQGWLPGRWALLGGALVALHTGIQFYWSQSYWGGSLALAGGALLFGALPRLLRGPRPCDALLLATGVAILANSRLYEGFVASALVAVVLGVKLLGPGRPPLAATLRRLVLPAGALLAVVAVAMGVYNQRVTGDPFTLPYQVYEAAYSINPVFLWQEPRPAPVYRHAQMELFYQGWVREQLEAQRALPEVLRRKGAMLWFFAMPSLAFPLLLLPFVERSRRMALAGALLVLAFAATLAVPGTHAHYFAPAAPLLFLLAVQGLRHLRCTRWGRRRVGAVLVAGLVALQVAMVPVAFAIHATTTPPERAWADFRVGILDSLSQTPGRHLVLVRYGPRHSPHEEWVYNEADIDGARVVWARDLGPAGNRDLLAHFDDRRVWTLATDTEPLELLEVERGAAQRD